MAAIYVVAAWVILQVADLAFPALGISESAIRYVWIGGFLGFPLALIFSWLYELTPDGVVRTPPADPDQSVDLSLKKFDYAVLMALIAIAGVITWQLGTQIQTLETADEAVVHLPVQANSIAVLPLDSLSDDPDQDYFAAGMHDALITVLSKISSLKVISRTSTNRYKDTEKSMREIGRELGVETILEGSVYRVGDQVRIVIQAIDADSDEHIWAENYEREMKDVLALQNDVVRAVAESIRLTLTPAEEALLASAPEINPETYEAYLKGMFHINRGGPKGFKLGLQYLNEAVENDPNDAFAHAGLALAYVSIGHIRNDADAFEKAKTEANRALELDDTLAQAHLALADVSLYYDWDWATAESAFKYALELNPNLADAHVHYAWFLELIGHMDEAIEMMGRATELDPLMPLWPAWLSYMYWDAGQLGDAMVEAEKSLELAPDFPFGLLMTARIEAELGNYKEAIAADEKVAENLEWAWGLAHTYAMAGREDDARKLLEKLESGDVNMAGWGVAATAPVHVALGDHDAAIARLEMAYAAHVNVLPWIRAPLYRPLSPLWDDPRFKDIVARMNIPGTRASE